MVQLFNLAQSGNHKDSPKLHIKTQELHCLLEYGLGYVSPCKEALSMLGLPAGVVRELLPALNLMERDALEKALRGLDLLQVKTAILWRVLRENDRKKR